MAGTLPRGLRMQSPRGNVRWSVNAPKNSPPTGNHFDISYGFGARQENQDNRARLAKRKLTNVTAAKVHRARPGPSGLSEQPLFSALRPVFERIERLARDSGKVACVARHENQVINIRRGRQQ